MTEKTQSDNPFEGRTRQGFFKTRIRAGRNPKSGKSQQLRVTIATTDETVALARLARLRELSAALITQGLSLEAAVAIKKAAAQDTDAKFEMLCETALSLAPQVRAKPKAYDTFRELAEAWTRGELHRRWPDHVKKKRTAGRDRGRLEVLFQIVVDAESKRTLGDMPLSLITFEHANAAMVNLPDDCKRPAARRQYAQLIGRVMKLAVFPAACVAASPLPPGFLPHVPEGDILFQHLYPDEDLRLMRCVALDYAERALFGLSNREGGRLGEFLRGLKWTGIDPKRGTITLPGGMHRKGGKPSKWQAEPGSIEALEPLRALGLEGPFYHLPDDGKWAERLLERMRTAELDREALYYSNVDEGVRRMRGHDTRATYLTLGIAAGLSETHLMARTGHTTSKMVHRYDHAAEALAASDTGCRLMPLDVALGAPLPGARRAGWMTLDPSSPEAATLERLALTGAGGAAGGVEIEPHDASDGRAVTAASPLDSPPADGQLTAPSAAPGRVEADHRGQNGAPLLDESGEFDGRNRVAGVDRSVRRREQALEQGFGRGFGLIGHTIWYRGGETLGETFSRFHGLSAVPCDENGGCFDALVAPAGVEPARLAARDFKSRLSLPDGADERVTQRTVVAGGDGKAHGVSPEGAEMRRSETPGDPVLVALRAAAHAAVERDDTATVAAIMRAIEQHGAGVGGVVPEAGPAEKEGAA